MGVGGGPHTLNLSPRAPAGAETFKKTELLLLAGQELRLNAKETF